MYIVVSTQTKEKRLLKKGCNYFVRARRKGRPLSDRIISRQRKWKTGVSPLSFEAVLLGFFRAFLLRHENTPYAGVMCDFQRRGRVRVIVPITFAYIVALWCKKSALKRRVLIDLSWRMHAASSDDNSRRLLTRVLLRYHNKHHDVEI